MVRRSDRDRRENALDRSRKVGNLGKPCGFVGPGQGLSRPGQHQDAVSAKRDRWEDVAQSVADPPALLQVEIEARGSAAVEQSSGFPAFTVSIDLRQVGAVEVGGKVAPLPREQLVEARLCALIVFDREKAAGNA